MKKLLFLFFSISLLLVSCSNETKKAYFDGKYYLFDSQSEDNKTFTFKNEDINLIIIKNSDKDYNFKYKNQIYNVTFKADEKYKIDYPNGDWSECAPGSSSVCTGYSTTSDNISGTDFYSVIEVINDLNKTEINIELIGLSVAVFILTLSRLLIPYDILWRWSLLYRLYYTWADEDAEPSRFFLITNRIISIIGIPISIILFKIALK